MDEQLQKILSIESIPGETADQQADRLSIERNLDSATVRYKLSEIYKSTLGDAASMDKIVSTLQTAIDNPTTTAESNKIENKEEVQIKEEVKERGKVTMAENNMFNNLSGEKNLNNVGTGAKTETKAPKNPNELSEASIKSLTEAGISVDEVKALFANKEKLQNLGGGNVKVEKYFAVKEPAADRLAEYKNDDVAEAYSLGQTVSGRLGYIVKPTQKGDINSEKFQERIDKIRTDVIKLTGFNDNGTPSASTSKSNPQHIKNLVNILTSAANLGDNETPDTYKGIIPDDKLANHPGKILVGNNIFLADTDSASKVWSFKAVELSDKNATEDVNGTKFNQLSFQAAGKYMKDKNNSMILASDGKSAIMVRPAKKKVNGVETIVDSIAIDGKKDITKAMIDHVARVGKKQVGYIRVDAKLLQPITYTAINSKNKAVTKKLKIKVYAKVYTDYALTKSNLNPCLSVAKAKQAGTGRAVSSMLSDFSSGSISMDTVAKLLKRMKKQGITV